MKYGPGAFRSEVLETVSTRDAANETEEWWIGHFCSDDRRFGYNLDAGGRAKGTHPSSKKKMSESHRRRYAAMTPEQREERRRICTIAGRTMTREQKAAAIRINITPEQRRAGAKKPRSSLTRALLSDTTRAWHAKKTPEQRLDHMRHAIAAQTPGRLAEFNASRTHEERADVARRGHASKTPERRREEALRGWATRRAKRAR